MQELGEELREIGEELASEVQDALQEAGSAISQGMGDGQALSGWLQGLLGNWGQYCTWQEQREIAVDSHIENLSLYISNKNGNLRLVGTDDEHISVQLHVKVQADSEEDARQLVSATRRNNEQEEAAATWAGRWERKFAALSLLKLASPPLDGLPGFDQQEWSHINRGVKSSREGKPRTAP